MSKEVKKIEETIEVLNTFHFAWAELNKAKKETVRDNYSLFAIAGTVVLDTTTKRKRS